MPTKTKRSTPIIVEEEVTEDPEGLITFKKSHFYSILVLLAFAAGVLVGYVAWAR